MIVKKVHWNANFSTSDKIIFFISTADQSLLKALHFYPNTTSVPIQYNVSNWQLKVYKADFDLPVAESTCTPQSLSSSLSKVSLPFKGFGSV